MFTHKKVTTNFKFNYNFLKIYFIDYPITVHKTEQSILKGKEIDEILSLYYSVNFIHLSKGCFI